MMIMASIFLSGLGWVVLQACFVRWVGLGPLATGLGWVGSQKMDPRPCLIRRSLTHPPLGSLATGLLRLKILASFSFLPRDAMH